ncbi:hypothetical protein B841_02765 [Corynebacterium maris DSM 45190]|uniref:Uncharacterized protein n=1 Tax=Corynebacterium maris DSM 45190 TaxID=1224163 RepID=S5TGL6_9CORY|nr:hypothetical protein [Corynebacterium maris]AGS34036.1 hypothetical protein B841_02765 [Corynebacterium maris DSM 45190]
MAAGNFHNAYAPEWKGRAERFDPAHAHHLLKPGEPDPAQFPAHARGTWRRALLFLSLGYRPEGEDVADLERWTALSVDDRREELARHNRDREAVKAAAVKELASKEVASATALARRLSECPGLPHADQITALLETLAPIDPTGEGTRSNTGGTVKRLYIHPRDGRPGHYVSRSARALRGYAETAQRDAQRAHRREQLAAERKQLAAEREARRAERERQREQRAEQREGRQAAQRAQQAREREQRAERHRVERLRLAEQRRTAHRRKYHSDRERKTA